MNIHILSQRYYSAQLQYKYYKDKFGRIIYKNVKNPKKYFKLKTNPSSKVTASHFNPTHLTRQSESFSFGKILTPINIAPKPLDPLPSLLVRTNHEHALTLTNEMSNSSSSSVMSSNNTTTNKNIMTSISSTTCKPIRDTISRTNTTQLATPFSIYKRLSKWLADNYGILILNMGSLATLTGFTRTDILELRILSITGSLSSVIYFFTRPPPLVVGSVIWSLIFASTNAYMVYYIYEERKGQIQPLTEEQKDLYEEHFMPHGVTPRQFEKLIQTSKVIYLKSGHVLIQKGQELHTVYLVSSGATEAVGNLSRRITAASSSRGNKDRLKGGDSGAWVGEFLFLDYLRLRDLHGRPINSGISSTNISPPGNTKNSSIEQRLAGPLPSHGNGHALVNNNIPTVDMKSGLKVTTTIKASDDATGQKHDHETNMNKTDSKDTKETIAERKGQSKKSTASILTYIATQDSKIYAWDHEELASLLDKSVDLRSAVTRAMTAAVVGKVVNLYISHSDDEKQSSDWIQWLKGYWSSSATGDIVRVNIVNDKNINIQQGVLSTVLDSPSPRNSVSHMNMPNVNADRNEVDGFGMPSDR